MVFEVLIGVDPAVIDPIGVGLQLAEARDAVDGPHAVRQRLKLVGVVVVGQGDAVRLRGGPSGLHHAFQAGHVLLRGGG